jgi:hypothetical protein
MPESKQFVPFELERVMSLWENVVEYNLSESGVHPMTTEDLIEDPKLIEELLSTELNYPQTNGTIELRERIAGLYIGARHGAGRRDRRLAAQLHADLGHRAEFRAFSQDIFS